MSEKRRLGRGLDALLGGSAAEPVGPAAAAVAEVPIERIQTNPYQPRREFDPDALATLKDSLAQHGLLQPLVVRPLGEGSYQLIAGERRLRAAREVGWQNIAVHVVDLNDRQVFEAALVENLQRSDLNPLEKAQGFHDYATQYQATHDDIAKAVGLDRSTITNLIRLLELPPSVQDAVRNGADRRGPCPGATGPGRAWPTRADVPGDHRQGPLRAAGGNAGEARQAVAAQRGRRGRRRPPAGKRRPTCRRSKTS